ncbi:MAG: hypothetical protein FJZ75_01975 [Bacteroidetes bacterium]|nr:hypothetical protein [Bacteroidota bacterium]
MHVFSLDVVLAAMAMAAWVFSAHQAPLNGPLILSLGLFVWAVYLFDHALDATRLAILGPRRQTHFKNRKVFWLLATLSILGSASLCLPHLPLLNSTAFFFLVSALVLLIGYLTIGLLPLCIKLRQHKEFLLPAGYTFGVSLPFLLSQSHPLPNFLFLLSIGILIFQSILLMAKIDTNEDALENNSTDIQLKPPPRLTLLFFMCSLLWLGVFLFASPNNFSTIGLGFAPWALQVFFFLNPKGLNNWKMRTAIEWSLGLPGFASLFTH